MTKAIILAGGMGTRLGKYTENLPKCMLNFLGKSLIERQIETFRRAGINDIIVVRKHLKEKINIPGVKYIDETDYETHMVAGFLEAKEEFDDDIILSYGDVLFELGVLKKVMDFGGGVGVVADVAWKEYWAARLGNWQEDSESFIIGKDNKITSLGISNPTPEKMNARYVGIIKFSKKILPKIVEIYNHAAEKFWEKPWHTSKSFKKAYMTDFLQELIDKELDVQVIKIKRGWMEFDTTKDYELALKWEKEGSLTKFYDPEK